MKTTKKDWIYRVILLILLAIIWDIGAALTSPIFVPQKGAVFREFFLLIQNGTMLKAFRYSLVRITVVAELKANEQVADVYSNLDRLRASTGTDKMLNATRDGLQESREKAAGAKVLYQTSREGKLDKADANTADYKVNSYLDSLKKSNPNVTTYSIPDLNALTKSSGLNTQSKK